MDDFTILESRLMKVSFIRKLTNVKNAETLKKQESFLAEHIIFLKKKLSILLPKIVHIVINRTTNLLIVAMNIWFLLMRFGRENKI